MLSIVPTADTVARCLLAAAIVTDEYADLTHLAEIGQNLHNANGLRARYIAGMLLIRLGFKPKEELGLYVGLGLRSPVPTQKHSWFNAKVIDAAQLLYQSGVVRP